MGADSSEDVPRVGVPSSLGEAGAAFWSELHDALEFDAKEEALVLEACRTLDRIEALHAAIDDAGLLSTGSTGQVVVHPAVAELRQQQTGLARLLSGVVFPDGEEAADRFRQARAHAGADARWGRRSG